MVRQLFEMGIIQSGFWHQFALTAHSPVGLNPSDYGITPNYKNITFANNDVDFKDHTGIEHSKFSFGLKKSLFNFMHGIGFELSLQEWFDFKIPKTQINSDFIEKCLETDPNFNVKPSAKIVWLGAMPIIAEQIKTKRGITRHQLAFTFHSNLNSFQIVLEKETGDWLLRNLPLLQPQNEKLRSFSDLKKDFEMDLEDFELFWFSKPILLLKENGLLVL
jgi:hypothetical protein